MSELNLSRATALVFDNHCLFADSFSSAIENLHIFPVTRTFYEIEEVMHFFKERSPEQSVLFADYYLPGANFIAYINELRRISKRLKIVIVSSLTNPVLLNNLLTSHIDGFLSKNAKSREIIDCIQTIQTGSIYLSPDTKAVLENSKAIGSIPFSIRELEILSYFANGMTVDATAEALNLSRHTIAAHRRKMMAKANSNNITELLSFARSIELI